MANDTKSARTGALFPGSLPWQLDQLSPGDCLLFPDTPNRSISLSVAVKRYATTHGGKFSVQVCTGMPATFDGTAFRFYRILRLE